jgi:pyrroloquinoline quinone biosynthesis protein D
VKFRFDETRQRWVVLAPERLLLPDELSVEILRMVDGKNAVDDIVDALMAKYSAQREEILGDVTALLQDLADKGTLTA